MDLGGIIKRRNKNKNNRNTETTKIWRPNLQ